MNEMEKLHYLAIDVPANFFNITPEMMTGANRTRSLAWPRQVTWYVLREKFGLSFPHIGKIYGKDHTSVIHGFYRAQYFLGRTNYSYFSDEMTWQDAYTGLSRIIDSEAEKLGVRANALAHIDRLPQPRKTAEQIQAARREKIRESFSCHM